MALACPGTLAHSERPSFGDLSDDPDSRFQVMT